MKYVSIDIETTGINREFCDMIEFGAILEDTNNQKSYEDCPKFHRYLKPPREEGYQGELYALNMHGESGIIKEMNRLDMIQKKGHRTPDGENIYEYDESLKLISPRKLKHEFCDFLIAHGYEDIGHGFVDLGKVTVAGKNFFAFDWYFLAPLFGERVCRRAIDPSVWYWNHAEDERIPSTVECLGRAGMEATGVHTSLGDAWDIIRLTRRAIHTGAFVPDVRGT